MSRMKNKFTRYIVSNEMGSSYEIIVNEDHIVVECSSKPNNRDHWSIGNTLNWLENYYGYHHNLPNVIMTPINSLLRYHITKV